MVADVARRGHLARECRSCFRCRNCWGRHHRSICQSPGGALASEESTQQSSTNIPTQSATSLLTHSTPPLRDEDLPNPTSQLLMAKMTSERNEPSRILLQTATAAFFNPDKPIQLVIQGTIVFDTGSQQSYIVLKATESLQLRKQGSKLLSILHLGLQPAVHKAMISSESILGREPYSTKNLHYSYLSFAVLSEGF